MLDKRTKVTHELWPLPSARKACLFYVICQYFGMRGALPGTRGDMPGARGDMPGNGGTAVRHISLTGSTL